MNYRHPRAKRLKVVFEIAEREEQDALQRWGLAQQKLEAEKAKRSQLSDYAGDYQRRLATPGQTTVKAGDMHNTLGFIRQIESALRQQEGQIAQLETLTAKARTAYLEARGKTEAMKKMLERLEQEYQSEQNAREQREADEWSNRQAARRTL
ncbi:MAG: flagellar export protein FliJ [Thalassolituus sp.]|nr:MAG: flagellar export protein FliJ [Thalassolituus sp.]